MNSLTITAFYLSLLALLYLVLSVNIIRLRYQFKTGLGDGGHAPLAQAIRGHGNFAEYVPIVVLLLACYEVNGGNVIVLHGCGAAMFIGRVLHSIGLHKTSGSSIQRQVGMVSVFMVMTFLAVANIVQFFL